MTDNSGNYLYRLMRDQVREPLTEDQKLGILDLGQDVRVMLTYRHGKPVGLTNSHATEEFGECGGSVTFDVPEAEGIAGPRWTLHSLDPLHVEPSVLCRRCGHHGWIRNGQWESA